MMKNRKRLLIFCLGVIVLAVTPYLRAQTIYVSSSQGNDSNNGHTQTSPLKTISAALEKGKGNTILLKAGDVFFEEKTVLFGNSLGKYGKGKNPELCGYKRVTRPNWEQVSDNIWRICLTDDNFSGVKVDGSSYTNNIGCLHEYDKDIIHGRKRKYLSQLNQDWDIWQTEIVGTDSKPEYYDSLYLYYSGNPNNLKLEFSTGQIAVNMRDATIENVNVTGYGFGISAGSNVHIKGCHIDAIGGRTLVTSKSFVCDGNGIGIWIYPNCDTENTIVEDCYISRVYDSGVCLSGSGGTKSTARNVVVRNNLIAYCCQGWEDFLLNDPPSYYENCIFENNIVVFSGESGFGYPESRFKYCHILSDNHRGDKKMQFRNNTFIGGNYHCNEGYKGTYTTNIFENNICYITKDNYLLGNYMGTRDVVRLNSNSNDAILKYRELTKDKTTTFKIKKLSSINRQGKREIRFFLRKHSY